MHPASMQNHIPKWNEYHTGQSSSLGTKLLHRTTPTSFKSGPATNWMNRSIGERLKNCSLLPNLGKSIYDPEIHARHDTIFWIFLIYAT